MTPEKIALHAKAIVAVVYGEKPEPLTESQTTAATKRVQKYLTTIPRVPSGDTAEDRVFDAVCDELSQYL